MLTQQARAVQAGHHLLLRWARELLELARAMTEALGDTDGVVRACNKATDSIRGATSPRL